MKRLAPLLVLGVVLGCGGPALVGPAELELGTGSYRFEALADGQGVELVRGAQGGWHVWLSVRVRGVELTRPVLTLTMQAADGSGAPHEVQVAVPFEGADDEGYQQLIGYTGIFRDPSCLVGELVRIRVELSMDEGESLYDERDVLLQGGVYPPPGCELHPTQ